MKQILLMNKKNAFLFLYFITFTEPREKNSSWKLFHYQLLSDAFRETIHILVIFCTSKLLGKNIFENHEK